MDVGDPQANPLLFSKVKTSGSRCVVRAHLNNTWISGASSPSFWQGGLHDGRQYIPAYQHAETGL